MSSSARAPAAARSLRASPKRDARCWCSKPAAIRARWLAVIQRNPELNRLPDDYDVPVFHPFASENEAMKWDFYVRHYRDDVQQRRDSKGRFEGDGSLVDGVLYPRAGTLGGCTAHNAMFLVYPHNADWDGIARATGDSSWNAGNMRRYFERLENCRHRPLRRWLSRLGWNPTRHGWNGWLHTEKTVPLDALDDKALVKVILESVDDAFEELGMQIRRLRWWAQGWADANDWRLVQDNAIGVRYAAALHPRSPAHGHARAAAGDGRQASRPPAHRAQCAGHARDLRRTEPRRRASSISRASGSTVRTTSRARPAASGGKRVPRARSFWPAAPSTRRSCSCSRASARARRWRTHGIQVRVDLAGVGKNLQDRYEVGVINRMNFARWKILEGAKFAAGDPQYDLWSRARKGVYATNGAVMFVIARSAPQREVPDLFCFPLVGRFEGYFPGYSRKFPEQCNYLTWAVLKAHTNNRAGEVTLRSADPRDPPRVNFHYFEEGDDKSGRGSRLRRRRNQAGAAPGGGPQRLRPDRGERSCLASTCSRTTRCASSCATTPGAITPRAPARSAAAKTAAC